MTERAEARPFTTDREHLQRRIGMTYGLFALLVGGLFGTAIAGTLVLAPARVLTPEITSLSMLGAVGLPAATWALCRRGARSWVALAALDSVTLLGFMAFVAVAAAHVPVALRGDHQSITVFALVVALRAALVPVPPRWTALVTACAALPIAFAASLVVRHAAPVTEGETLRAVADASAIGWCVAATVAAWAIARVVYGIRSQLQSAQQLGQYTLEEKIGEGGMGTVYRARHAMLRRPTAIKLLRTTSRDDVSSRRFEREVQLTSALTHPNTIAVYDYGHTNDGVFYYAMELLDGATLAELCEADGPLPPGRVVHVLRQVAEALAEAHAVGLIHRDVKPANIFLTTRGGVPDFVKLLDFGLVKEMHADDASISRADLVAGTPHFMAPETVASPEQVDFRVDLYALGAVGYTLLTGEPPFTGSSIVEVYHGHLYLRPPPIVCATDVRELELLLLECLAKRPDDRPPSARALGAALRALQVTHPWSEDDARAAPSTITRARDGALSEVRVTVP